MICIISKTCLEDVASSPVSLENLHIKLDHSLNPWQIHLSPKRLTIGGRSCFQRCVSVLKPAQVGMRVTTENIWEFFWRSILDWEFLYYGSFTPNNLLPTVWSDTHCFRRSEASPTRQSEANLFKNYLVWMKHNGSFSPKLNFQPTGFRLAPDWLWTSFRLVNAVGLHWWSTVSFTPILESNASWEPVWSQSVAILIWCEWSIKKQNWGYWVPPRLPPPSDSAPKVSQQRAVGHRT